MLNQLNNPHLRQNVIHIAGTNGKGSTLVTLEGLLVESGFTTGSTISPHLVSFNERFRINGQAIPDEDLDQAFEAICQACDIDLNLERAGSRDGTISPTFFEFSIAIAFFLFQKYQVDYVLLETGMGGRLDATNVVPNPLACVLTRIALDHQEYLGKSLEQITQEKLGIVKQGSPVIIAPQEEKTKEQILQYCAEKRVKTICYPDDFDYKTLSTGKVRYRISSHGNSNDWVELNIEKQSLLGEHQRENTATALAVYHTIIPPKRVTDEPNIQKVLNSIVWDGRLQYLDKSRRFLIDGAHNNSGFRKLIDYLNHHHADDRILFAIAWKQHKNIFEGIDTEELQRFDFQPLQMKSESAESIEEVVKTLNQMNVNHAPALSTQLLLKQINENQLIQYDLIVISGSLYLIGEFIELWKSNHNPPNDYE